ncbi:hypothetical protein [Asticcacaulis sp.]|uniref:hypothetical protein n=1 Tax=Asticcacaulis sp. TaxID=1872648 RepID=UPI003F7BC77A
MNARVAPVEIRYPQPPVQSLDGLSPENMSARTAFRPLPISIQTENARLELIQAGQAYGAPLPGVYRPADADIADDTGWMWAVFTNRGDPLGFVSLNPAPASSDFDCYFGPHLDIACRRDRIFAPYVPEVINGLLGWLRDHDICFVIHAEHAGADSQLADWLVAAGFLYTGCRSRDGRQQMICLL